MKIKRVWFENETIFLETELGHIVGNPLKWFPKLLNATQEQRNSFRLGKYGIHWSELDEDLSYEGFFTYKVSEEQRELA